MDAYLLPQTAVDPLSCQKSTVNHLNQNHHERLEPTISATTTNTPSYNEQWGFLTTHIHNGANETLISVVVSPPNIWGWRL